MVCVRPGVGPVREAAVCQQIKNLLVRVILRAKEDEVLKSVRQPIMVVGLSGEAEVAVHNGGLCPR